MTSKVVPRTEIVCGRSNWEVYIQHKWEHFTSFRAGNVRLLFQPKAINHSMYVPGLSCTPVASISIICVVLSGYRCVPLFVQSGLLYLNDQKLKKINITKAKGNTKFYASKMFADVCCRSLHQVVTWCQPLLLWDVCCRPPLLWDVCCKSLHQVLTWCRPPLLWDVCCRSLYQVLTWCYPCYYGMYVVGAYIRS